VVPDLIASKHGSSSEEQHGLNNIIESRVNHGLTQPALVPPLIVLTSTLCHTLLEEMDKTKYQKRSYGGRLRQPMLDSCCCLDRVVPEEMSQVWRRSEVGNHKQRTLNTRQSSGTSEHTSSGSRIVPGRMTRSDLFWYWNKIKNETDLSGQEISGLIFRRVQVVQLVARNSQFN